MARFLGCTRMTPLANIRLDFRFDNLRRLRIYFSPAELSVLVKNLGFLAGLTVVVLDVYCVGDTLSLFGLFVTCGRL